MDNWSEKTTSVQTGYNNTTSQLYRRFLSIAHQCLVEMAYAQSSLQPLHKIFSAGYDIRQNHCSFVISSLSNFKNSILLLRNLLRELEDFPIPLCSNYYVLIVSLGRIDDHGFKLNSLISSYRPYCCSYTKSVLQQKYQIQLDLKKFTKDFELFLTQFSHLIEEIHSLERQQQFPSLRKPIVLANHEYSSNTLCQQEEKPIFEEELIIFLPSYHSLHSSATIKT